MRKSPASAIKHPQLGVTYCNCFFFSDLRSCIFIHIWRKGNRLLRRWRRSGRPAFARQDQCVLQGTQGKDATPISAVNKTSESMTLRIHILFLRIGRNYLDILIVISISLTFFLSHCNVFKSFLSVLRAVCLAINCEL